MRQLRNLTLVGGLASTIGLTGCGYTEGFLTAFEGEIDGIKVQYNVSSRSNRNSIYGKTQCDVLKIGDEEGSQIEYWDCNGNNTLLDWGDRYLHRREDGAERILTSLTSKGYEGVEISLERKDDEVLSSFRDSIISELEGRSEEYRSWKGRIMDKMASSKS